MTVGGLVARMRRESDASDLLAALFAPPHAPRPEPLRVVLVAKCAEPSRAAYVRGCRCPGCRGRNARYQAWWRRTRRVVIRRRIMFVELPGGQFALRIGDR